MEKIDIILWIMGSGFVLMLVMWNNIHSLICSSESRLEKRMDGLDKKIDDFKNDLGKRIDTLDKKIDDVESDLGKRIDILDKKIDDVKSDVVKRMDDQAHTISEMNKTISDIDKRMYGIEAVLHMKDCCVLKQDQNLRKAE